MNPDKFTHKTNEALVAAHELDQTNGHAQITPLHLAVALISDANSLFRQSILNATNNNDASLSSFERVINNSLKKISSQSPPPDEVPAATALIKVIRRAQSSQKTRGDTHLAIDQLILGLLEDAQIADCLKEAGIRVARVRSEVEKLRGKEGKKVESASGDTNFHYTNYKIL